MKNQLNEKQKLLLYKYGFQAFIILMIEIGIIAILYACREYSDSIYNLLNRIKTKELFLALIPLPIGYFAIRGLLSDCDYAKLKGFYYLVPFYTIIFLLNSKGMIYKIPLLIVFWILFIITIYKLIENKKAINIR